MATTKKYVSLDKLGLYHEKEVARTAAEVAAAVAESKDYADSLAGNYEPAGAVATAKSELEGQISTVEGKADAADAKAVKAQEEVDALELVVADKAEASDLEALEGLLAELDAYVGDIPEGYTEETIIAFIQKRAQEVLEAASGGSSESAASVLAALNAYKAENDPKVTKNAQDIATILADYLKAADKDELQGKIDAVDALLDALKEDVDAFFKDADMTESAKDTLKELQEYIASDESGAAAMAASIKQNTDAIDAVEGRMDTAEDDIDAVEGRMDAAEADIDALQALFGEGDGSVQDMIDDAVAVETQAREAAIGEVQADADKGIADAAVALAAAQAADAKAVSLNETMDGRVAAVEAKAHEHANKAELDLIATGDKAKWDAAEAKAHEHANKVILDGVTAEKVAAWDAAEGNAKTYAEGLNSALEAKVTANTDAINSFVEVSEQEINDLFQ